MNYHEARAELKHILENQKTVEITKLKMLLRALNFSLDVEGKSEIDYIKSELKRLNKMVNSIPEVRRVKGE